MAGAVVRTAAGEAMRPGPILRGRPSNEAGLIASPTAVRTTTPALAELALTGGTMTLVLAPEEHPRPIGLGPKRAAIAAIEAIGDHATPVTEALHVPLHLVRGSAALVSQTPLPRRSRNGNTRRVGC